MFRQLVQDSKALFIAYASYGNYATTSFSIAVWAADRIKCAKQAELVLSFMCGG